MSQAHITVFKSAARTVDVTREIDNNTFNGGRFIVDVTALETGTNTVTVHIDGYDFTSGKWYTILDSAALSTTATTVYTVFPGATIDSNVVANSNLPRKFRVQLIKNGQTLSQTVSVGVNLFNV